MLSQRSSEGYPVGADAVLRQACGPIPEAKRFQRPDGYGFEEPEAVLGWQWSETFGRWGAIVRFASGWEGLAWPERQARPLVTCKVLRDAFFGHNREAVFAAIPDLPQEAFGACRTASLVPFAERAGLVPQGELVAPEGTGFVRYGIGGGVLPHDGPWMEHSEVLPETVALGEATLKEHILGTIIVTGNRYGCCWFIGWAKA